MIRQRVLGRTGLRVSELGFGAWGIGKLGWGVDGDDRRSLSALKRALELGVDFFDTAYAYGNGHSENLIAFASQGARKRASVATKIPPRQWPCRRVCDAFAPGWIVQCTERSLKNLGVETIDLQQFHQWDDRWLAQPAWDKTWTAIERLKRDGKIRFWGASIASFRPESALELAGSGLADAIQVIFNLFEQAPADALLPLCQSRGVGVIARSPLDEGGLTGRLSGDTRFDEADFRRSYFGGSLLEETVRRSKRLEDLLVPSHAASLAQAALRFCLSFPAVSTVIPGMRRPEHVEANVRAAASGPLPKDVLDALRPYAWTPRKES